MSSNADVIDISTKLNMAVVAPPEPGVYAGISEHIYHSWRCASNSSLSLIQRSPAHLKAKWEEPQKDTDATRFGRASHCAILEPDEFPKRYICGPDGDRRTAKVRDAWAELEMRYGPDKVMKTEAFERCLRIRDALHRHPRAGKLLATLTHTELTVVWDDAIEERRQTRGSDVVYPATGLRCKARFDGLSPAVAGGCVVDLKSCEDARADAFERSIWNYGYHRQGALYLEGAAANALPVQHYVIIAYEKEPPYALMVYRAIEAVLDAGAQQVRPLLRLMKDCLESNEWPAYPEAVVDVTLPDWAWNKVEQETR